MASRILVVIPWLLLLAMPSLAGAAITLDATSSAGVPTGTSISATQKVTNANEMLVACIFGQYSTSAVTPTVTYDGVTMTQAWLSLGTQFGGWEPGIYYLYNPPTGSNTLTVNWGRLMTSQSIIASSWTGTASYIGATSTAQARTNTASVTLTTKWANSDNIDCAAFNESITPTQTGTNQTTLYAFLTDGREYMSSSQTTASAGSYTLSWTGPSDNPAWYDNVLELPAATSSSEATRPSFMEFWGGFFRQVGGQVIIR